MSIGPFPTVDPAFLAPTLQDTSGGVYDRARQRYAPFTGSEDRGRFPGDVEHGFFGPGTTEVPDGYESDPMNPGMFSPAPGEWTGGPEPTDAPAPIEAPSPVPQAPAATPPPDISGYRPQPMQSLSGGRQTGGMSMGRAQSPAALSGSRPAFLSAFRGLLRSPFAQQAQQSQQPLAPQAFAGPQMFLEDEQRRRSAQGPGPAFLSQT